LAGNYEAISFCIRDTEDNESPKQDRIGPDERTEGCVGSQNLKLGNNWSSPTITVIIVRAIVKISPVRNSFACGSAINSFFFGTMFVQYALNFEADRAYVALRKLGISLYKVNWLFHNSAGGELMVSGSGLSTPEQQRLGQVLQYGKKEEKAICNPVRID